MVSCRAASFVMMPIGDMALSEVFCEQRGDFSVQCGAG